MIFVCRQAGIELLLGALKLFCGGGYAVNSRMVLLHRLAGVGCYFLLLLLDDLAKIENGLLHLSNSRQVACALMLHASIKTTSQRSK